MALAARTHDSAPVTDAVPTAEDTSASAAEEVVRKKKQPAGKARKASKSAAPVPVSDGSGDLVVLSGQGSGGAGGTGGGAPQEPSRKVRVDRGSENQGGGREQVEVVAPPVTEETPPPEQPQPARNQNRSQSLSPSHRSRRPASRGSARARTSRADSD